MSKKLLILIDCQNDFITGLIANDNAKTVVSKIIKKIDKHDGEIVAIHDTHFNKIQVESTWPPESGKPYEDTLESKSLPLHCLKLEEGWEIENSIRDACHKKNGNGPTKFFCCDKYTYGKIDLPNYLKAFDFDEIEICGFNAISSVIANASILRAAYPDMKIVVDCDCITDYYANDKCVAINCLRAQQIELVNADFTSCV